MSKSELPYHPLSNLFPLIKGKPFQELVDSIRHRGQLEPVWTYEGKILEGRNRYKAALAAGKQPILRPYRGDDPAGFVRAKNIERRHLSTTQRGVIAAKIQQLQPQYTTTQVMQDVGASYYTVRRGHQVLEEDPEQADRILRGEQRTFQADDDDDRKAATGDESKPASVRNQEARAEVREQSERDQDPERPQRQVLDRKAANPLDGAKKSMARVYTILRFLPRLRDELVEWAEGDCGTFMNRDEIEEFANRLIRSVRSGLPFRGCPACREGEPDCRYCEGHGWVPKHLWDSMPDELKPVLQKEKDGTE